VTHYTRRSLSPGNTVTWQYWMVHRGNGTLGAPQSFESEAAALECVAGHKAMGTPGKFGISHHLVIEHASPVEWLEETLRKASGPETP
jgi:hypothetical protein